MVGTSAVQPHASLIDFYRSLLETSTSFWSLQLLYRQSTSLELHSSVYEYSTVMFSKAKRNGMSARFNNHHDADFWRQKYQVSTRSVIHEIKSVLKSERYHSVASMPIPSRETTEWICRVSNNCHRLSHSTPSAAHKQYLEIERLSNMAMLHLVPRDAQVILWHLWVRDSQQKRR